MRQCKITEIDFVDRAPGITRPYDHSMPYPFENLSTDHQGLQVGSSEYEISVPCWIIPFVGEELQRLYVFDNRMLDFERNLLIYLVPIDSHADVDVVHSVRFSNWRKAPLLFMNRFVSNRLRRLRQGKSTKLWTSSCSMQSSCNRQQIRDYRSFRLCDIGSDAPWPCAYREACS